MPANTAIVYLPIFGDESGTIHNPGEALEALEKVASRPIIVDSSALIGKGATGGFVLSSKTLGQKQELLAARILNGEAASNIPIEVKEFSKPEFDARQLERWGINQSALPVGSDIRFQQLTAWQQYWWQILVAVIVIVFQCFIIGWLLFERRRRRFAEHESHQHLLEVAKMDRAMTVSTISASVAHELNQPLSAILNNAETAELLLSNDSLNREELKEILADIRSDDLRAVEIIKHIRALLKQDELDIGVINLTKLVSDTARLIRAHAKSRSVRLEIDPLPADIRVRADSVHIQQVILNLALNAIDAMQDTPVDERILSLQVSWGCGDITISIADNGAGIPKDKLNSIFEPFVTTKEQGTGLGLSIARTIILTYGGKIWAENGPNGGAIFRFSLNAPESEAA